VVLSAALAATLGAALALLVAAALTYGLVLSGPVDPPRARNVHRRPTPTSGGLAILAGTGAGLCLYALLAPSDAELRKLGFALALAATLGLVGAVDDVLDLGAKPKLLIQAALALLFCGFVARVESLALAPGLILPLGPVMGTLGSALWIVVAINAVNFMDGANGLAPGSMVIAFFALAAAALAGGNEPLAAASLIAAAAGLGFLPWNLPGGRIFQGDAGALFSGALFSALALLAAGKTGEGAVSVYAGPLLILPLLTDVFMTLSARAKRRVSLLQAHREHLYHRWLAKTGAPHAAVSLRIWALMAASGAAALVLQAAPVGWRAGLLALAVAVSVLLWRRWSRRMR
jgi:UDP-N-acetylmuramyl pentapeptide phosphotransferase/UDP-N-acetylglucosamine-1-phosphate transferase